MPGGKSSVPVNGDYDGNPSESGWRQRDNCLRSSLQEVSSVKRCLLQPIYARSIEFFSIGGAQAIAALAFGTGLVPKVDKIVGLGNIYVATAKEKLFGRVGLT